MALKIQMLILLSTVEILTKRSSRERRNQMKKLRKIQCLRTTMSTGINSMKPKRKRYPLIIKMDLSDRSIKVNTNGGMMKLPIKLA
jgi:hypothetical protein